MSFAGVWPYDPAASPDTSLSGGALGLVTQPVPTDRDWSGMRRDTGYFMFYQFAVIAALYVGPESISGWSSDKKENFSVEQWKGHVRHVVWDHDDLFINYVLHPYWGATYFTRAQNRGFGKAGSFWYSAMLSTIYEFGAEALFEYPSIQDMIVTPVVGSFIGDYFMDVRADIRERELATNHLSGTDHFLLIATDPLGVLNEKMDGLLGRSVTASFEPVFGPMIIPAFNDDLSASEPQQTFMLTPPMLGIKTTIYW